MNEEILWKMLGHLVCITQWGAFIAVDYAYLGRSEKVRHPCVWAAALAAVVLLCSIRWDFQFFSTPSVISNVIYLLLVSLLFGGTMNQKLTACLINGVMCLLTENTVSCTYAWCVEVPTGIVWRFKGCLVSMVLAIVLVGALVAYYLHRWRACCALEPLQAIVMNFFPGVVVVLNIVLMLSGNQQVPTRLNVLLTLGLTVAVLVHIGIVQMFNDQVVQRQSSRFRAQLEQQRAEALLDSYTAQRQLTHEFTNHMAALAALLSQNDLTGAQQYIASVSKAVEAGTTIMDTHNPLLDSILSKKYEEAAEKGVDVYFDLCNLKALPFDSTDMVIVLSNLLDNAIRAAAGALPPEVYVRIRKTQDEYLISVRNRVQEDMEIEEGALPRSTKKENGHGMGLVNVQEVLEKYEGEYTVSCRDKWFRFTCSLPAVRDIDTDRL